MRVAGGFWQVGHTSVWVAAVRVASVWVAVVVCAAVGAANDGTGAGGTPVSKVARVVVEADILLLPCLWYKKMEVSRRRAPTGSLRPGSSSLGRTASFAPTGSLRPGSTRGSSTAAGSSLGRTARQSCDRQGSSSLGRTASFAPTGSLATEGSSFAPTGTARESTSSAYWIAWPKGSG